MPGLLSSPAVSGRRDLLRPLPFVSVRSGV